MGWQMAVLLAILHDSIHQFTVSTPEPLSALQTEIHEISTVGLAATAHANVSNFFSAFF